MSGSTLVETLVLMIVAGIVFLSVLDGLTLFTRLQLHTTEQLQTRSRTVEGYYRTEALVSTADSAFEAMNRIFLYHAGRPSQLLQDGDVLVYTVGEFRDTLLRSVESLRLLESDPRTPDTVAIGLQPDKTRFTVKFPLLPKTAAQYTTELERIEQGYGYEKQDY